MKRLSVFFIVAGLLGGCSLLHPDDEGSISVRTDKEQYQVGEEATVRVVNRTDKGVWFVFYCTYEVQQKEAANWKTIHLELCPPRARVAAIAIAAGATYQTQVRLTVADETMIMASEAYRLRFVAFLEDQSAISEKAASSNAFRLTR